MNNPVVYDYKGSQISFMSGENTMINATQMAKPFNKRTNDWLSLKQTNELIISLSAKTGIPATGLVIVNQGGNVHENKNKSVHSIRRKYRNQYDNRMD